MVPNHKHFSFVAAALVLSFLATANATVHNVNIGTFFFSPTKTTVVPGDTVRWHLLNLVHSTTSDPTSFKQWDSGFLSVAGDSFDVVFTLADGPGPFPYHCAVHPAAMKDTIFVNYHANVHFIRVGDFFYSPTNTHVNPGDTVIWGWQSGLHNTASDISSPKSWTSPNLSVAGDFYSLVFDYADAPGPFPYHCDVHPTMQDTIFMNFSNRTHFVRISDFAYTPTKTQIQHGDTVIWIWQSGTHTSTSDVTSPKSWSSPTLTGPTDHFDVVFSLADGNGPWPYHCEIHPTMMDTIFFPTPPPCNCGDANGDASINISDAVFLIQYIFAHGTAPDPLCEGDANGDGSVNISDAVYLIQYIFAHGAAPHCP